MLPTIILQAEIEELGINAGLQDRVIQVYEGCVFMDFDKAFLQENNHGRYKSLNPSKLNNLYIAYKVELGKVSGTVLNDIRARYDRGDEDVVNHLKEIADLAEQGKKLIEQGELGELNKLINRNFDLRTKIMNISDSNMQLVKTARSSGASAKFAGSGGSIIGFYENDEQLTKLIIELKKIKARVIKPFIF